ncbi:hypothetical protein GCM10020367_69210 [Streptomyces sannanensis]|uniref:Uncharacterized protein n=1 Tax=Streptomyces sannanensis TaxID=285536 RepID=A0ABP6SNC7_9ACTN
MTAQPNYTSAPGPVPPMRMLAEHVQAVKLNPVTGRLDTTPDAAAYRPKPRWISQPGAQAVNALAAAHGLWSRRGAGGVGGARDREARGPRGKS